VSPILFGTRGAEAPARAGDDPDRLQAKLSPPRSRFELQAGHVIPAALVTALNSDLPGRVIAQVTANVYDSVSGDHLLVPQGARLLGTYRDGTRYGDRRILLVWNRLILPNGWSLNLEGMEASDPTGAAGLTDRADNHLDRLAAAVALSSIISVVANEAEDKNNRASLSASLGDAAAQEAARTGARIVDRELTVRPTLRVRAGAPVRVLVSQDIQLRPYRE
jgi:type IV secretion system protein TrbI